MAGADIRLALLLLEAIFLLNLGLQQESFGLVLGFNNHARVFPAILGLNWQVSESAGTQEEI